MKKFTLSTALNQVLGADPYLFGIFSDSHLLGVTKINQSEAKGFWETHHHDEELLIILAGKARFLTLVEGQTQTTEITAGDMLWVPRGIEHSAEILEELHVLFISPQAGNSARVDNDTAAHTERLAAHNSPTVTAAIKSALTR